MQPFDLVIRGGTVATATDSFKADVGIRGAKIAAIGEGLDKGKKRNRRARQAGAARRCGQPQPHRAVVRLRPDERRHLRERHHGGGLRRHHHGHLVCRAARRHEPEDGGRRVSRVCRARRRGGLRVPHDPRRPARGGAGEGGAAAGEGRPRLAEGVHDLRPAEGRRRAIAQRAAVGARQPRDGLRACREPRHDLVDGQAAAQARLHRTRNSTRSRIRACASRRRSSG